MIGRMRSMRARGAPRRAPAGGRATRAAAVLAVAVAMVIAAGCGGAEVRGVADDEADLAPPPSPLAAYYEQDLAWSGCADFAVQDRDAALFDSATLACARLEVPLDYDEPEGATVSVGVLRAAATGERRGAIVFNPGGPGASGMTLVAQMARYQVGGALAEHFDLVGVDPRGVGASQPQIRCLDDAGWDRYRALGWPDAQRSSTPEDVAAANRLTQEFVEACVRNIEAQGVDGAEFIANVGSATVARDLDVLRAALGDPQLNYVGYSHGTVIGTAYAERFPDRVRAMVLDGVVDPRADAATSVLRQNGGFARSFENFDRWCVGRQGCAWAGRSAADAVEALFAPLMDAPLPLPDGRVLSFGDATIGIVDALYDEDMWAVLASALGDLADGDPGPLMALADDYYDRDAAGHYSRLHDAFNVIRCLDTNRIDDPAEMVRLHERLAAQTPFLDNGEPPAAIFDVCTYIPALPTLEPHVPDVDGLAPVLVISTTDDPATPYESGVNLVEDLDGRLLTVEGNRHTAYLLTGNSCADRIGNAYLIGLELPAAGARC